MTLTEAQSRAASAPGSVAVVAGAGSGKTHMLVARYLHHLEAHALTPLQVVAVTFTERAAAELRARIRRAVTLARPDDFDALAELEAAQISTIHGLCARILRDHPRAADVRPDAQVMDEQQSRLWLAEHFRPALAALPEALVRRVGFARLAEVLPALLADPLAAERALMVGPQDWAAWAEAGRAAALTRLLGNPAWPDAVHTLEASAGADGDRIEDARRAALAATRALRGPDPHAAAQDLLGVKLMGGSAKAWPSGQLTAVKDAIKALRALAEEALADGLDLQLGPGDAWLAAHLPDLRAAFTQVQDALRLAKRRAGLLTYADLEVQALRALQDPAVRAHYARRWQAYLVDEVQDTNPVQAELLDQLRGDARLTLVGDEKQSIYSFRRADVTLFRRWRAHITAAGGADLALDVSFRTHAPLVERSNAVFAALLGDLHAPLRAHRSHGASPHNPLEAWVVDAGDAALSAAQARRVEAAHLARRVQALLAGDVPIQDGDAARPVRPGDIAILSRTWAPLDAYGAALAAAGVPARDAGSGSLLDTQEAQDALRLLAAVALHDPLAIVSTLRSPWCAVSDTSIHQLHDARGDRPWMEALQASEDPKVRAAFDFLERLRAARRDLPASRLLQLADRLRGYSAVLTNLWNAPRRLADWRATLDLVRGLERGEEDAFSVTRRLRDLQQADAPLPRPALEAGNAVSLLTVHAAKGLEWPVVILADLGWTPPNGQPNVLFSPERGVALLPDEDGVAPPVAYRVLARERQAREAEEARRVLYVALTRARDHLILSASGGAKGSLLAALEPGLRAAGVPLQAVVPQPGEADLPTLGPLPDPPNLDAQHFEPTTVAVD